MPVTARLSRLLHERFGDDIATQLLDWLNAVEAAYQNRLPAQNDSNSDRGADLSRRVDVDVPSKESRE